MRVEDLEEEFELAIEEAVRAAAAVAAAYVRETTPPERVRTRAAVFYKASGRVGVVGLQFARQYSAAGTETRKRLLRQFRAVRPRIVRVFVDSMNEQLAGA